MQKIRLRFPPLPAYFFECVLYNNFNQRNFFFNYFYISSYVSQVNVYAVLYGG